MTMTSRSTQILFVLTLALAATLAFMVGSAFGQPLDAAPALDAAVSAPAPTPTPAPPVIDPDDAGSILRALYEAATAGKYKVAAGLAMVLLVFGLRRYALGSIAWFQTKPGGVVLGLSISLLTVVGLALASGSPIAVGPLLSALGTAAAAAGIWEWVRDLLGQGKKAA